MEIPETRYVESGGIMIAYQVHGSGDHDLLFSGSMASNVETAWLLPEAQALHERLGRFARVIRFDRRDTGVSDAIRDDLALEAHAADALAVMDAIGAERPVLLGLTEGARSLAVLAATQPERAAGLIALGPSVRGAAKTAPDFAAQAAANLIDSRWPEGIVDIWAPDWAEDPVRRSRFVRYLRTSVTPRQARRLLEMSMQSDVSEVLPLVQCRTLVLRPEDSAFPAEAMREFASMIPRAEYRTIPGSALVLYALDIDVVGDVIEEFVTGSAPAQVTDRVLATVLFTDLVGSTERASTLGDRSWVKLLERHLETTRRIVSQHGGKVVKTLGDGSLASFSGPAQGVRCAERVIDASLAEGLEVRSGLHTGELELTPDGDVAGLAVHLAARIMGLAGSGEVLVSRTVRDLVVGSELRFADHGEHDLKGIDEPWRVYALATPSSGP